MQNFMKTILSAVQYWTKGKIEDKIKNSTADWNQNDSNADSYIKNRTHWEEPVVIEGEVFPLSTLDFVESTEWPFSNSGSGIHAYFDTEYSYADNTWVNADNVGSTSCYVYWDGAIYNCEYHEYSEFGILGNESIYKSSGNDTGEPFVIITSPWYDSAGLYIGTLDASESHTVGFGKNVGGGVHKIDEKYLPDLSDKYATVEEVQTAQSTADNAQTTADSKMNNVNPVGTGSFSMNRKSGTTVGEDSHAEGTDTTASGESSHAEGYNTIAFGLCSHAEGRDTIAKYNSSHAEGRGTKTQGRSMHVCGEYNLYNDFAASESYRHGLVCVVGNGTSDTARSNAYTLDWNGIGWYQGGLQVGGNAKDDGAKNVLLEGDAIPVPEVAAVGQVLVVKAVDENGKPTEWEAVDSMIIASSTEGSTKKFKITVDDSGTLSATEVAEEESTTTTE